MVKKLILCAVLVFAAMKFSGVSLQDMKHGVNSLSQRSAQTMMGGDGSGN